MITGIALFSATFFMAFALGLQCLAVIGAHVRMTMATSFAIASMILVLVKVLPGSTDALPIICYLIGGPLGATAIMKAQPWLSRVLNGGASKARPAPPALVSDAEIAAQCDQLSRSLADRAGMSVLIHLLTCASYELRTGRCARVQAPAKGETP